MQIEYLIKFKYIIWYPIGKGVEENSQKLDLCGLAMCADICCVCQD